MVDASKRHDRTDHCGDGPCAACYPECAGCGAEIIAAVGGYWTLKLTTPEGIDGERQTFCLPCVVKLAQLGVATVPETN